MKLIWFQFAPITRINTSRMMNYAYKNNTKTLVTSTTKFKSSTSESDIIMVRNRPVYKIVTFNSI
jgi:hypothetical protein